MKRLIVNVLIAMMLLGILAPVAWADESILDRHIADGTCGEGLSWSLDGYTLTITGDGEMEDGCPWIEHMDRIEHVVLDGEVTKIGKEAFYKFDRLETVDFGEALVEIGTRAFSGCTDIAYIHLPDTFRTFGAEAFRGCTDLQYVYCDGPMPRFNDSCLWTGNYISVFYPTNCPWPNEYTSQLVNNFGGRLGIMMGNFDESVVLGNLAEAEEEETEETEAEETEAEETEAVEETTVATEAPTMAPTEAPTEAPTVPTTVPTEAPTEAPTVAVAAVETQPEPTETQEELELLNPTEPEIEEKVKSKSWIGLVMIAGVLTFLIAGAMIVRGFSRKGRY